MGSFKINTVKNHLKGNFKNIDTIVETGTFKGIATRIMAKSFKKVYTIELSEQLHKETKSKMLEEGYSNVDFFKGDSGELILTLSKEMTQPAVFFLDAHWSGDKTVNWEASKWKGYNENTAHLGETEKPTGEEQVPLTKEMNAISMYFKPKGIIYIDDLDKFDRFGRGLKNKAFDGEDYSHLNLKSFRNIFGYRLVDWVNLESQLIIKFDKLPENETQEFQQKLYYYSIFQLKYAFRSVFRHLKWLLKSIALLLLPSKK